MDLKDLYAGIGADTPQGDRCRALLRQTHWFSGVVETDPRTGLALPLPLSTTLRRIRELPRALGARRAGPRRDDRLWRIAEHARPALQGLAAQPRNLAGAGARGAADPGGARARPGELHGAVATAWPHRPGEAGEQALPPGRPAVPVDRHPAEPVAQGVLRAAVRAPRAA